MPSTPARVLVLGGTGMLGHRAWIEARARADDGEIGAFVAVRDEGALVRWPDLFDPARTVATDDLTDPTVIGRVLESTEPTAVINAAGVVKQRYGQVDPGEARAMNADLPHALAEECVHRGVRLVHVSTDCVFSGLHRGPHGEDAVPDPVDDYGRDKFAGEPTGRGVATIRTSLIGRELERSSGLVEWLLAQDGHTVPGFRGARFSGLVGATLARLLVDLSTRSDGVEGLFHLAAEPVDKHRLLVALATRLGLDVRVEPVDEPVIDRALDGRRLAAEGVRVPDWDAMLDELAVDADAYAGWRTD